MDLTAFESGTLQEILAPEGTTVPIGQPVARIGDKDSAPSAPADANASPPPGAAATESLQSETPPATDTLGEAPEQTAPRAEQPSSPRRERNPKLPRPPLRPLSCSRPPTGLLRRATRRRRRAPDGKIRASPMARHIAAEHGLDLTRIEGSGPQGRVIRADVEAALAGQSRAADGRAVATLTDSEPQGPGTEGQRASRQQPARTTSVYRCPRCAAPSPAAWRESTRTVPHFFLTTTVDVTELVALRKQILEQVGEGIPSISINDLLVKAAALAIRKFPDVNVSFADDSLIRHRRRQHRHRCRHGARSDRARRCATSTRRRSAQIARETRDLAERASAGKLQPPDYSGGTFTIWNLGHVRRRAIQCGDQSARSSHPGRRRRSPRASRVRRRDRRARTH